MAKKQNSHPPQNPQRESLNEEFGEGFSYANLRNMRQFYRTYPDEQICYTICSKLEALTFKHKI